MSIKIISIEIMRKKRGGFLFFRTYQTKSTIPPFSVNSVVKNECYKGTDNTLNELSYDSVKLQITKKLSLSIKI